MNEHLTGFIEGLVAKPLYVGVVTVGEETFRDEWCAVFYGDISETITGVPVYE